MLDFDKFGIDLEEEQERENPLDEGGTGRVDDEPNDIPGEQAGEELDIHAENRQRDSKGRFL